MLRIMKTLMSLNLSLRRQLAQIPQRRSTLSQRFTDRDCKTARQTAFSRCDVMRQAMPSDREARKKELEQFMKQLAKDKEILNNQQLLQLWEEIQEVTEEFPQREPNDKAQARDNMQSFLEALFHNISTRSGEFVSKERTKQIFSGLPPDLVERFKEIGVWDRIPNAGFTPSALEDLELWTEEEYKVFSEDPNKPPPLDEEEEIKEELLLISAVRKLEKFLSTYPDDPAEVLNMMVAAKIALEANTDPFNLDNYQIDDVDEDADDEKIDDFVDIDGIEACLKALEEGEDVVHPDPAKDDVIEADTPEVFLERMQLMRDFYWDPHRDPKDRVLSKAEHKEIKRRWDAFLPDEDPVSFQDIKHSRLAPKWPEWMEGHFRTVQHILYILRAAHINAKISEPAKRLEKYNRVSPDMVYTDPAVERQGFEAFISQMQRLEEFGVTSEPNAIFCDCVPPKEKLNDPQIENPWTFSVVVDQHMNIPIPDWYHKMLDDFESQMSEDDMVQGDDELPDVERYQLMESMDRILKKKPIDQTKKTSKRKKKRPKKESHPSEIASKETKSNLDKLNVGVRGPDPNLYKPVYLPKQTSSQKKTFTGSGKVKGDFWYEGPLCEAWKEGYMITVNATLIYKIDVVARQVNDVHMRWGAILGSVISAEDAERLFCEASGIDYTTRRYQHDFVSEWKEFEYKPIRKNPTEWFMKNILGL